MDTIKQQRVEELFSLSKQLEKGHILQITALSPIKKLIEDKEATLNYYLYLLQKSFGYYQLSQSLSTVTLSNNSDKHALYQSTIKAMQCFIQSKWAKAQEDKLLEIYEYFQQQFPGWKRVSIHATRRKLHDPDQLLLEQTARYAINKWWSGSAAYELSQYYCCNYKNYRMKISKKSANRVNDIAQYFDSFNLRKTAINQPHSQNNTKKDNP